MTAGRPSKLTEEFIGKFCSTIKEGVSIKGACGIHYISTPTYYRWIIAGAELHESGKKLKELDALKVRLFRESAKALGELERDMVRKLKECIDDKGMNATAAAIMLERRFQKTWSRDNQTDEDADKPKEALTAGWVTPDGKT